MLGEGKEMGEGEAEGLHLRSWCVIKRRQVVLDYLHAFHGLERSRVSSFSIGERGLDG